jgi:hypothetical protein
VKTEAFHLVTLLGQGGRGGSTRQPAANHDDLIFTFVARGDELAVELERIPLFFQRAGGDFTV